jgi:hypothetical protein
MTSSKLRIAILMSVPIALGFLEEPDCCSATGKERNAAKEALNSVQNANAPGSPQSVKTSA